MTALLSLLLENATRCWSNEKRSKPLLIQCLLYKKHKGLIYFISSIKGVFFYSRLNKSQCVLGNVMCSNTQHIIFLYVKYGYRNSRHFW